MPWETDDSSGFLTDLVGTIQRSWYNTDPKYNNGETLLLHWEVEVKEVTQEGYEGDLPTNADDDPVVTFSYPVGRGWESTDSETAVHPKRKMFHASSIIGRVLDAVTGAVENYGPAATRTNGDALTCDFGTLHKTLDSQGLDPVNAGMWQGLTFEFAEIEIDYGPDKEEQKKGNKDARMTSRRSLPIRWVSEDNETKPATAKAAAAKAKAKAAGDPFGFVEDVDVRFSLQAALDKADDYGSFVDAVVEIDTVASDNALLEKVLDQESGPWATKAA